MAFLARYSGRALDDLEILKAARAHVELYRCSMEARGSAASTIDRRLSTVCGFYRFAHIDSRIASNPAQYVRRPKITPSEGHGMDRGEADVGVPLRDVQIATSHAEPRTRTIYGR
ncbi:MAG: integrase/recombinase XerD [Acidimicrobiaceae bacterium]|nr:integrase/recombinase XerD [Acidimicrobiaceae bacterium]